MANVLNEEKKQQVLALGRLGWSLRQIQQATRIRRETASAYLKAAGIAVRSPSGWGRGAPKPANEVITDSGAAKPAIPVIRDPLNPNFNPEGLVLILTCWVVASEEFVLLSKPHGKLSFLPSPTRLSSSTRHRRFRWRPDHLRCRSSAVIQKQAR